MSMHQPIQVLAFIGAAIIIHAICSYAVVYFGEQFYRDRVQKCPRPKVFDLAHKVLPNLSKHKMLHGLYDVVAAMQVGPDQPRYDFAQG